MSRASKRTPVTVDTVTLVMMARATGGTLSDYIVGRRRRGIPAEGTWTR